MRTKNTHKFPTLSPLRYPGGKSVMFPFLQELISKNFISPATYVEPYAGGAGAALALLWHNCVKQIYLNDANIAIFSFWHSLLRNSNNFLHKFDTIKPSLDEWYKQKEIFELHQNDRSSSVELGFATFFLNRTNHSGILSAGPIGGRTHKQQESAKYTIDARYNKTKLFEKLNWIIKNKSRIKIFNLDALELLRTIEKNSNAIQSQFLIYLDPPYFIHGKRLYMDFYTELEHKKLASHLTKKRSFKWILSYDNVEEIVSLYPNNFQYPFSLNYSAAKRKKGKELLICSPNIVLSDNLFRKLP